jgi:hypothetical protein
MPAARRPQGSKFVSALTTLKEAAGRFDPRPGDGLGVRGVPGDLQKRQPFGKDLAVERRAKELKEPTAGLRALSVHLQQETVS